jgi:hypothetical protein
MLSDKARRVLLVMAGHYERDPEGHLRNGVPLRVLGAETGAYLGHVTYEVQELVNAGFISRLNPLNLASNVIITQKGHRYIRPPYARLFHWIAGHKVITLLGAIVGIIGIMVGILNLLRSC